MSWLSELWLIGVIDASDPDQSGTVRISHKSPLMVQFAEVFPYQRIVVSRI